MRSVALCEMLIWYRGQLLGSEKGMFWCKSRKSIASMSKWPPLCHNKHGVKMHCTGIRTGLKQCLIDFCTLCLVIDTSNWITECNYASKHIHKLWFMIDNILYHYVLKFAVAWKFVKINPTCPPQQVLQVGSYNLNLYMQSQNKSVLRTVIVHKSFAVHTSQNMALLCGWWLHMICWWLKIKDWDPEHPWRKRGHSVLKYPVQGFSKMLVVHGMDIQVMLESHMQTYGWLTLCFSKWRKFKLKYLDKPQKWDIPLG